MQDSLGEMQDWLSGTWGFHHENADSRPPWNRAALCLAIRIASSSSRICLASSAELSCARIS
eukprot:3887966-Amphidinium_carterae.1